MVNDINKNQLLSEILSRRKTSKNAKQKMRLMGSKGNVEPHMIPLKRIKPYSLNPRKEPNSVLEGLVESIKKRGLIGNLAVTQEPESKDYVLFMGKNTTLEALNRIHKPNQLIPCEVHPYPVDGDVTLLIQHLIENDVREGLSLVDRAKAFEELKDKLQKAKNQKISQQELLKHIKNCGYSGDVNQGTISKLLYLADISETLPSGFSERLTYRDISDLSALENKAIRKTNKDKKRIRATMSNIIQKRPDITLSDLIVRMEKRYKLNQLKVELGEQTTEATTQEKKKESNTRSKKAKDLAIKLGIQPQIDQLEERNNTERIINMVHQVKLRDVERLETFLKDYDRRIYGRILLWAGRQGQKR